MTWKPPEGDKTGAAGGWTPPAGDRTGGKAPLEEGITPENPLETATNLVQAAGALIKSRGLKADQYRFGAHPSDSVGGVAGAVGTGIQKVGEAAGSLVPKSAGDVAGMMAADVGGGLLGKGYNKFLAASPELRMATDKAISTAKSLGFKLMPSQETGSYLAGLAENVLRKLPGGAAVIQRYEQAQNTGFVAAKNKILEGLGRETETEFGGNLKQALGASHDALTAKANELLQKGKLSQEAYGSALSRHEQRLAQVASDSFKGARSAAAARLGGGATAEGRGLGVQVERAHQQALDYLHRDVLWGKAMSGVPHELDTSVASNLTSASDAIAKRLEGAGIKNEVYNAAKRNLASKEDEEVADILSKASKTGLIPEGTAGEKPTSYTLKALQDKQSFYGDLAEGHRLQTGGYDKFGGMYRQLQKAAQADMDVIFDHAGIPGEAKLNWQIAKAFSKETSGLSDLKVVKQLWNENPSAVLDSVVKAGDRRGTQILVQALGGGDMGKTQVRRHVFDTIFGAGDAPIPSRDKIMARMSEYSENLTALFSPAERGQLQALGEKAETPQFIRDRYDRRVKEILDTNRQRALMTRDPQLKRLAQQRPQQLVNSVLSGDPEVVRSIRKYVPAQEFAAYQRYGMRDLLADPVLPQKGTLAIKDELARKPEFYKELLGEKNWKEMQHIGEAELLLPGYKDLKSPSRMAVAGTQLGMAATFGVMGIILHPFGSRTAGAIAGVGLGLTIAPQALAELYLSDAGRRIMTTLFRLPQTDARAQYLMGKLAAAGYIEASNHQRQGNETPP